jgi:hypothetical protein
MYETKRIRGLPRTKIQKLKKAIEKEILRKTICQKEKDRTRLRRNRTLLKNKLDKSINIFNREGIMEEITTWEEGFRKKIEGELKKKRIKMGLELEEE